MLCGVPHQIFIIDIILQTVVVSTSVQAYLLTTMDSRTRKFWDQVRDAIAPKHYPTGDRP